MITAWSAAVARHRRAVVTGGVAAATAAWSGLVLSDEAGGFLTGLYLAAVACLLAAGVTAVADRRRAGRGFEVIAGSFRTPRGGTVVLAGLAHVALIAAFGGPGMWLLRSGGFDPAWVVLLMLTAAPFPAYAAGLWRGVGVTLTARGVRVDRLAGSLTVPWEALDPGGAAHPLPGGDHVALRYARPGLVRARGLTPVRDRCTVEGTTAGFTAAALSLYAAHPDRRAAIGSAAEHDRLRRELTDPAAADPGPPAPTAQALLLRAAGGVLVFAAATTAGLLLSHRHAVLGQAALLPAVLGLRGALAATARWRVLQRAGDGTSRPAGPPGGS